MVRTNKEGQKIYFKKNFFLYLDEKGNVQDACNR